jgi:hypothetical protein
MAQTITAPPAPSGLGDRIAKALHKRIRQRILLAKWRQNYSPKAFDWDWKRTNFNRIALVNLLCAARPGGDYLEIGCQGNALFDSVPAGRKVGVDPEGGGTHRMTSDAFFRGNTDSFDVVFIDGLHTYEQVRRDVVHAMACLRPGGWIALHDMLPRDWLEEHVPRLTIGVWTGDVWKVAFELASSPGIDFRLVKIDCGVGVFRLTDPRALLVDRRAELERERFAFLYDNLQALPLVDWPEAYRWIRQSADG